MCVSQSYASSINKKLVNGVFPQCKFWRIDVPALLWLSFLTTLACREQCRCRSAQLQPQQSSIAKLDTCIHHVWCSARVEVDGFCSTKRKPKGLVGRYCFTVFTATCNHLLAGDGTIFYVN